MFISFAADNTLKNIIQVFSSYIKIYYAVFATAEITCGNDFEVVWSCFLPFYASHNDMSDANIFGATNDPFNIKKFYVYISVPSCEHIYHHIFPLH